MNQIPLLGVRHEDAEHDLLAAILAAKEQGIRAILAFAMAYLRGRYNGGAFTKNSNRRNDVRHYRLVHS